MALVFVVHAVSAVALMVGYQTRLATIVCWFMAVSLHVRVTPFLKMGGDAFVACTLLFGVLLPLGARWSWDARHKVAEVIAENRVVGMTTTAFILQICVVYWMTGWLKTGHTWADGTAVWYLLNLKPLTSPLAPLLAEQYWLMAPLTLASHALERWGAFVLFIPFFIPWCRLFAVVSFSLLHIGMGVFLYLGPYPIMCIAGWLALLPSEFWDRWLPKLRRSLRGESQNEATAAAPAETNPRAHYLRNRVFEGVALILISHVLLYSGTRLGVLGLNRTSLPSIQIKLGRALDLNNSWSMMSPNPGNLNWWFLVDGIMESGEHVDPFHNQSVSWERPENILESMRSWRWRLSVLGLLSVPDDPHRRIVLGNAMGDYLCRVWNAEHTGGERLRLGRYARVVEPIGRRALKQTYREWVGEFDCRNSP